MHLTFATIGINSTIIFIMIGDIITQMISHQLGAIARIVAQINIKTGHFRIDTRVAIIETDQTTIIRMIMIGTKDPNMSEGISSVTNSSSITTIKLDKTYSNHLASFNGNDTYMGDSNYNSTASLSDVSSSVTCDGVTFDAIRNHGFPNVCTVK